VRPSAEQASAEQAPAELAAAERLVRAIADALRGDAYAHDVLIRVGWDAGTASHGGALSLHYLLKELDLLMAMVLYAGKRALAEGAEGVADVNEAGAGAADGVEVARRVQRAFSLLTLAASKGFAHAFVGRLQEEYRTLRHELRNPLGTIQNAVSLMGDERLSAELRDSPRYRAMVTRNAASIDTLIAERLGDTSALAPEFGRREVSLRDIALSVRRDLREEAREKGCEIVVGESLPTALVDPTGFELALKSAVTVALHAAPRRSAVAVTLRERRERSAVVTVGYEPAARGEPSMPAQAPAALAPPALARELLEHSGGRVWTEEVGVCFEVPTSSTAHSAYDVAGAG
jgi:signal transduction histidine kinase